MLSSLHAQDSSSPKWCSIGGREALRCLCFPAGLLLTGGRQLHDGVQAIADNRDILVGCIFTAADSVSRLVEAAKVHMEQIARPSSEPQGR